MALEHAWVNEISWIIPGELAAFSRFALDDLERLREAGIGAIVSLTEDFPAELIGEPRFATLHLPVEDMTPPDMDQVARFVAFVDAAIARGTAVGVHCHAGLGRTGTMIACHLVTRGMTAAQAIEHVRQKRPGSIQTDLQEDAIRRWARIHRGDTTLGRFL